MVLKIMNVITIADSALSSWAEVKSTIDIKPLNRRNSMTTPTPVIIEFIR